MGECCRRSRSDVATAATRAAPALAAFLVAAPLDNDDEHENQNSLVEMENDGDDKQPQSVKKSIDPKT